MWELGTVCCRLEASEFELCGLIKRGNRGLTIRSAHTERIVGPRLDSKRS